MNNAPEENVNGGGRKPVVQKEIGPEDVENVIDFDVDSDEEIELEDLEQDDDSSDETEPLQAADFLLNAEEYQQVPDADEEDSDHMSEISQTADDDMSEFSQTVDDDISEVIQTVDDNISEINPNIGNLPEVSVTEGDERHQAMDVPEDSTVDEDSIDIDQYLQGLEQNLMEIADILKGPVEHRRGGNDENQLSAEGESAPIAQWLNTDICAGASGSNENRKLKLKSPVLGKDQECGSSRSDQDQKQDNVLSRLEKDQEHNAKSCSSEDRERNEHTSDSGKDQEEPFDKNEDKDKENRGSSNLCEDQNNGMNGGPPGSGDDPVGQQIHEVGLVDCGEIMERLELEVQQPDNQDPVEVQLEDEVQQPDIQDPVVVQQEMDGEIDTNVQNAASGEDDDRVGTNGRPDSGKDPEDQQLKVEQIVGNEADVAPELVQEQDVIDAVPELDFVPENEQNNLVEEIVEERQAILEPVPVDIVAVAVAPEAAAEGQNNEVLEEVKAEVPVDAFIHMA